MFAIGGLPALLVVLIRYGVTEPSRWKPSTSAMKPLAMIFSREYRRRTILNSLYLLVSITGLWAGSVYVPTAVTALALKEGVPGAQAASLGTAILSIGTILGCIAVPILAERIGRRATLAVFFAHHVLLGVHRFRVCVLYAVPRAAVVPAELVRAGHWRRQLRDLHAVAAGAISVPNAAPAPSASRHPRDDSWVRASRSWLGAGVAHFGSVGIPVALTSIAFLIGLILLPFGVETKGQPLPE